MTYSTLRVPPRFSSLSQLDVPMMELIKGILQREAIPSWECSSEQQGNLDGESQLLIGAEMEQIPSHHRMVLYFMLRERRDLPTN